jgi:bacterial leucyl aminopeptidase
LVLWMEGFGTRNHKASQPNRPVEALEARLKEILKSSKIPYSITLIDHSRTRQKSVKLSFSGHKTPGQKIILGAHFDSIAGWGMGDAPGADDNASGSANLIEVAQILSQSRQPQKTIEFFWYAGEEGGLIGSGEIAKTYKAQNEKVIAVMQLDMTAFPGDGPFQIGSVTDYTTPWVREFLSRVNQAYFQFKVNEFECGYGCSDHASWFRQGFETVAPFEARMQSMNRAIHTSKDRVQPSYNFEHSAAFSKLALAFALELDHASDLVK